MIDHLFREIGTFLEELFRKEETWIILFFMAVGGVFLVPYFGLWDLILYFLKSTWWLWVFLIIAPIANGTWLYWRQEVFMHDIKWIVLELRMPRHVEKSPQAMEQVLAAIHTLRNTANDLEEKYKDGEVTRWFAFEMVSFGGETHFYIRTYARLRGLVEAAFFSYYPDLDIVEVPDYMDKIPETVRDIYEEGLDMWGSEMLLTKAEYYPIKTYVDFESEADEKKFDPISTFLEVFAKLAKEEFVGVQILIAPAGAEDWIEKYESEVKKMREPETKKKKFMTPQGEEQEFESFIMRSPGQTDVLKAIEKNLSKPAFDTIIRFVYLSPKSTFYDSFPRRGIVGSFNQYGALDLNSFIQNYALSTRTRIWNPPYVFPKTRGEYRKARLLHMYRHRAIPPETIMGRIMTSYFFNWNKPSRFMKMNTECLASLFHVPTINVLTEPHIRHLESKKTGPPAGLAIFGGEEEVERYK